MGADTKTTENSRPDICLGGNEMPEHTFDIILNLSQPEKRELINLWKARKAHEQAAV